MKKQVNNVEVIDEVVDLNKVAEDLAEQEDISKNEVATIDPNTGEVIQSSSIDTIDMLRNPLKKFYTSVEAVDRKSKMKIFGLINAESKPLVKQINKRIDMVDVLVHTVVLPDMNTGEPVEVARTIILDKDGNSYACCSNGIVQALAKLFAIVGMPSWKDEPVSVTVQEIQTKSGRRVLTLVPYIE